MTALCIALFTNTPASAETKPEALQALTVTAPDATPAKFKLGLEIGASVHDEETRMLYAGAPYEFKVKYALNPGIRLRYEFNAKVALEGGLSYDWYRWDITPELTYAKHSTAHGYRLSVGPSFTFDVLSGNATKVFVQPTVDWQFLDFDLDLPVRSYKSGPGVGLAFGFVKGPFKFETGLSWSKHDPKSSLPGTVVTNDFDMGKAFIKTTVYYFDLPF